MKTQNHKVQCVTFFFFVFFLEAVPKSYFQK